MSFAEHDKIILIIIFSIVGFIFILLSICFLLWRIICYYRSKTKHMNSNEKIIHVQYHRIIDNNINVHKNIYQLNLILIIIRRKKTKRRLNTNDSAISLSFDPPHLINQNVKNLDKLLQ